MRPFEQFLYFTLGTPSPPSQQDPLLLELQEHVSNRSRTRSVDAGSKADFAAGPPRSNTLNSRPELSSVTPHMESYLDASTAFVSSSLPNKPKLLICPAFGAFSLGCAASALRYAACNAAIFAAYQCRSYQNCATFNAFALRYRNAPPSCGVDTRSSHLRRVCTS